MGTGGYASAHDWAQLVLRLDEDEDLFLLVGQSVAGQAISLVVPGDLQDFTIELYAGAGEVGGSDLLHSGIEGGVGGFGEGGLPGECQGRTERT